MTKRMGSKVAEPRSKEVTSTDDEPERPGRARSDFFRPENPNREDA